MLRLVKETEGGKSKWVARTVERKQMQECPGAVTAVQEEQARDQAAKQERSKGWGLCVTLFFGSLNAKESREGLTARATGTLPFPDFLSHKVKRVNKRCIPGSGAPYFSVLPSKWPHSRVKLRTEKNRILSQKWEALDWETKWEYKPKTENVCNLKTVFLKSIYIIITSSSYNANWAKTRQSHI